MTVHPIEEVLGALNDAGVRYLETVPLDATMATVVALQDLIALKRTAGRPQDLADIDALEAIAGARGKP